VWRVRNQLNVRLARPLADAVLSRQIVSAMERDPYIGPGIIKVNVLKGRVELTGQVNNSFQASRAVMVASSVRGVLEVKNSLRIGRGTVVKPTATTDRTLQQDIADALRWSPLLDGVTITVSVSGGRATLTGTTDTRRQEDEAVRLAYRAGATAVVDRLKVRYQPGFREP